MNYLKELNAFYDLVELDSLYGSATLLLRGVFFK